ncbi:MAG: hypothetical protein ACE5HO_17015, partial [bacterium]
INEFDDIRQIEDIGDFKTAHDLYLQALVFDRNNLDASFGFALTEIILLKDSEELQQMRDRWQEYAESDPDPLGGVEDDLFKIAPPMNIGALSLSDQKIGRAIYKSSRVAFANPPLANEMQQVVQDVIMPVLQRAIDQMKKIVANESYTFIVTSELQGGTPDEPEDPVELDLTDFTAFYATLLSAQGTLRIFLAYNLDVASYDSTGLMQALQQNSDFLTLQNVDEMHMAKDDLIAAADLTLKFIQLLRTETDNQDDDFITVDPGAESDLDSLQFRVQQGLSSLNGEVTLTEDFDDDDQTPRSELTISLKNFFENPPERPKTLLPSYQVVMKQDEGEDQEKPTFVWTAQSFDAWRFPDPTFGGLLPGMTDENFKRILNLHFIPGDIDLTVGSGTTPEYSWNKGPISCLVVTKITETAFETIWAIRSSDFENNVFSPVTHGIVPSDAEEEATISCSGAFGSSNDNFERVLTPGQMYRLEVFRQDHLIFGDQYEARDFIAQ